MEVRPGSYIHSGERAARAGDIYMTGVSVVGRTLPLVLEGGDLLLEAGEAERELWLYLIQA